MGRENGVNRDLGNFSLGKHGKTFEKRAHETRETGKKRVLNFLLHKRQDNVKIETVVEIMKYEFSGVHFTRSKEIQFSTCYFNACWQFYQPF